MDGDGAALDLVPARPRSHRRGLARAAALLLALQLPVAVGAAVVKAGDDGADETPSALLAAADATDGVDRGRFEAMVSFHAPGLDVSDVVMMRGEEAAGVTRMVFDFEAMVQATGAPPAGFGELEMVGDAGTLYIRAPLFAAMAAAGPALPELGPLVELGDRCGRVDLVAVGDAAPAAVGNLAGGATTLDIAAGLELMRQAAGDEVVLGTGEVRGTPVTRYASSISFGDLLEAQGGDVAALDDFVPPNPAGPSPREVFDAMSSVELDLEVGVDDAGLARRIELIMDNDFARVLATAVGQDPDAMESFRISFAIELFDLGDPTIAPSLPDAPDAVDLTPWMLGVLESVG